MGIVGFSDGSQTQAHFQNSYRVMQIVQKMEITNLGRCKYRVCYVLAFMLHNRFQKYIVI